MKNNRFYISGVALVLVMGSINAITPEQWEQQIQNQERQEMQAEFQRLQSKIDPEMLKDANAERFIKQRGYKDFQELQSTASQGYAKAFYDYSDLIDGWNRANTPEYKYRIPYDTEKNAITLGAQNGVWAKRPDNWTSLHEALQACTTWGWGKDKALNRAQKIIADAKTKNGDVNSIHRSTSTGDRTPLDVAHEYCGKIENTLSQPPYNLQYNKYKK